MGVCKTPEIMPTVELLSSEADLTGFLQNNCSRQWLKLPGKPASVLEKDFTMDVLLYKKLPKAK